MYKNASRCSVLCHYSKAKHLVWGGQEASPLFLTPPSNPIPSPLHDEWLLLYATLFMASCCRPVLNRVHTWLKSLSCQCMVKVAIGCVRSHEKIFLMASTWMQLTFFIPVQCYGVLRFWQQYSDQKIGINLERATWNLQPHLCVVKTCGRINAPSQCGTCLQTLNLQLEFHPETHFQLKQGTGNSTFLAENAKFSSAVSMWRGTSPAGTFPSGKRFPDFQLEMELVFSFGICTPFVFSPVDLSKQSRSVYAI